MVDTMGTIMHTTDDEPLDDHEGYVTHILDTAGSSGGKWTAEIEAHTVGWRAECSCGWSGPTYDSRGPNTPNQNQEGRIMSDWEAHARPLLVDLEVRSGLGNLTRAATEANTRLRQGVSQYKAQGATWEQIGDALGISRQTAWDRYGNRSKEIACDEDQCRILNESPTS